MDSGKSTESQGQRLSTYASSSSYNNHDSNNSPKTPKKSSISATTADKIISSRSNSKDESTISPHHLISEYNSYINISSPVAKGGNHAECILKCTCKHSSYTSLRSPKQNLRGSSTTMSANPYEKNIQKISKISCDAATSPNRFSQRSPLVNLRLNSSDASKELRISDEKTITAKTTVSPRRLIATRNAATSPGLDKRKLSPKCDLPAKSQDVTQKGVLEKANSLGESRPTRALRTTRSLSPRPPVRHQHAITVCDENDRVSVKISPNEDFEEELSESKFARMRYKAQSEQTSPNLSDLGTTFTYEMRPNNKSTGCLVYVPSDPWMKMTEIGTPTKTEKKKHGKLTSEVRSLSRGNLLPMNDDPWIWRSSPKSAAAMKPKSPKQEAYRQSKSFSATKFELNDLSTTLNGTAKADTKSGAKNPNRPKLQRSKSPIVIEDELVPFSGESNRTCTCNVPANKALDGKQQASQQQQQQQQKQNLLSPRKDPVGNKDITKNLSNLNGLQATKNFLNVTNSNLMQSRHSFSSISQKDDELQLNIRRLSEQIKQPIQNSTETVSNVGAGGRGGGADFTDYLNQFRTVEAQKAKAAAAAANLVTRNSSKNLNDAVLETTC